jgi:hypothetical protein
MLARALTATELATEAGITAATASGHLAKLEAGGLITHRRQGRHKYVTLASDEVAGVLEALMGLAAGSGHLRTRTGPRDAALREARVCYNHLAGHRGIAMFDAMMRRGDLRRQGEALQLTDPGRAFAQSLGVDLATLEAKRAPLCRECLDWSERRSHLAGSLGRAFLSAFERQGWANRDRSSRVVSFTAQGAKAFDAAFQA